jgi:uncharacterized protein (TIGR02118 family)
VNKLQRCIGPCYVPSFACGKGFASKRRFLMVKLTVLYGHPDDPAAFEEYYANTHLPLVEKMPNLQRYEAARVVAMPDGSEPPYYRIFKGYYEDMEQLGSSLSTPEGQAAANDIPNFATGGATIFIAEIVS